MHNPSRLADSERFTFGYFLQIIFRSLPIFSAGLYRSLAPDFTDLQLFLSVAAAVYLNVIIADVFGNFRKLNVSAHPGKAAKMVATRLEVNMTRLLSRCEEKVTNQKYGDWRLEKYIRALMEMFEELKKSPCCPSQDELNNYVKKIEFLKGLIAVERLPNAAEKLLAAEKLSPANTSNDPDPVSGKKLCNLTKGRYEKEMREDLFGVSSKDEKSKETELRHRKGDADKTDINSILQHHNEMQEKLAEEMLMLTRNLKNNVSAAKRIVGDDLRTLSDSSQSAEANMNRLKAETERLEAHTNSCTWWVWLMIAAVTFTFLWMIMFIRIFHK